MCIQVDDPGTMIITWIS